jgi:predicted secreted protein
MANLKTKVAASATTLALMATLTPALALASTTETQVWIQADDAKIVASAPTKVAFGLQGDGSLIAADASAFTVQNGSRFGIHVSNVNLELTNPFTSDGDNEVTLELTPENGSKKTLAEGDNPITGTAWNINKNDGTKDGSLGITASGKLENITADISTETQFGALTWTFASGSLS